MNLQRNSWVAAGETGGRKQVRGIARRRQGWCQWEQKESSGWEADLLEVLSDRAERVAEARGKFRTVWTWIARGKLVLLIETGKAERAPCPMKQ